jgi:hypothetical protein
MSDQLRLFGTFATRNFSRASINNPKHADVGCTGYARGHKSISAGSEYQEDPFAGGSEESI